MKVIVNKYINTNKSNTYKIARVSKLRLRCTIEGPKTKRIEMMCSRNAFHEAVHRKALLLTSS